MKRFTDPTVTPMSAEREATWRRLRRLGHLLDSRWRIPGTGYRFGVDGLLGLIPGAGDTITALLSAYILLEAYRLGIPKTTLLRMGGNIALDTLLGAVPVLGDVFDVVFKANLKNLELLQRYMNSSGDTRP